MPGNASTLKLETATPGDGPGEFANSLDPSIQLYDSTGSALMANGTPLADGRNEAITATGLTPGANYLIRLSAAGGTSGEYFLDALTVSTPPAVQTVSVDGGDPQRSRITRIDVSFSAVITAAPGAFRLTNGTTTLTSAANGGILISTSLVGGQTVATLTFDSTVAGVESGSLSDGNWTLTAVAANVTAGGTPMSADFTQLNIKRLFGDVNADGTVDGTDFSFFGNFFGVTVANNPFDFNNDGTIDGTDFGAFGTRFGLTL
jgi:hypothetical protein